MKRRLVIAFCAACLWATSAQAQTLTTLDDVRALTTRTMGHVLAGKVDDLITELLPY